MTRYKTVIFDDFSDGEQCDMIAPTEKSFRMSNNLVIQKNKIKLGKKNKGGVLYDSGLSQASYKLSFLYGSYVYLLSGDASNDVTLKRCNNAGSISTVDTLPDGSGGAFCFIKFRNLAVASYLNNAGDAYLCKYSTNGLTMTAWANTNLIALIGDSYIKDYKIIHDRLYILASNGKICYSDDGITFVLLVALDSSYIYESLEYLAGYLYLNNVTSTSSSGLIRISLSGEIQDETISVGSIGYFHHCIFAGNSYLIVDRHYLYRISGDSLEFIFYFEGNISFIYSPEDINLLYIWDDTNDEIIEMNVFEKFFRPFNILATVTDVYSMHKYSELFTIAVVGSAGNFKFACYEDSYTSPGSIQLDKFKIKGSFVPVQLTVSHEPLTANAWVKVYVKKDGASAWGSAVIDSNTTDAIKKNYDFPTGDDLRTIEFKIEYGTADDAETPEDATLEFIYLPIELANSE